MPRTLPAIIVEVAVAAQVEGTFHYRVPAGLAASAVPGKRVVVPFGRRRLVGYILSLSPAPVQELKEIHDVLDDTPLLTEAEIDFLRWASAYYLHPLGEVIKGALPAGINPVFSATPAGKESSPPSTTTLTETFYRPLRGADGERLGQREREVLELLRGAPEGLSRSDIRSRFPSPGPQLNSLLRKGLVVEEKREVYRDPFRGGSCGGEPPHPLNGCQEQALTALRQAISRGGFAQFLLHGVTGSGKTEVYLQAIDEVAGRGKKALVLVPEISLTPQLVKRFRRRFACGIAVLHSALSPGERYDEWRRIRRGEAQIVIGARSAVFAPAEDIGIIIVDEEHDGSYKQSEGFRYNARDLALMRGKREGALVVLGSATPQLGTVHAAQQGKLGLLELPQRVHDRPLPTVALVDMRKRKDDILSPELTAAIGENLAAGGQTLLFLNRRGFATYLVCRDCGTPLRCPNCAVTLTYHKSRGRSFCHYCDFSLPSPSLCPSCQGGNVGLLGVGTERVEERLRDLFPEAGIDRMDRDTTSGKGGHERVLRGVEEGSTDILIGTQMIVKGHDFPGVTLVGVLSADTVLHLPDFRSAERGFQLLTQVIGRAGRGEAPGRVLIQTLAPDHYAVQRALEHDAEGFYREELTYRQEAGYPPFAHLAALHFSGTSEEKVKSAAEAGTEALRTLRRARRSRVELLGPAPSPLARLRGRHRWQALLKSPSRGELHRLLTEWKKGYGAPSGVRVAVDVDPVEML